MKRLKYFFILCLVFETVIGFSQQNRVDNKKSPNIILIIGDDHGWSQTSLAMDPRVPNSKSDYLETPNLARLASQGMVFTNGYAPTPICTPTRRSILCGTSAARSGEEFPSPTWISAKHTTLPRMIKKANSAYRTAHFGKWGGKDMINTPEECGYDVSHGVTGNPDGDLKVAGDPGSGIMGKPREKEYFINDDPKAINFVTNSAIQFMEKETKAGHPFYMQVGYYAVHLIVAAREETVAKYTKKGKPDRAYTPAWAAMAEELDSGIARLLKAIDNLGIADNTYVVYTSDNGGSDNIPGGSSSAPSTNTPLTGAKQSLLEGGIRVPFMVRGPGIKAGSVCHTPVVGYDFLPTFYAIAGGKTPLSKEVDGGNFVPLFKNPVRGSVVRPNDGIFFSRPDKGFSAIRQGEYKLMVYWNKKGEVASRALNRFNPNPTEEGRDIAKENPQKADALQNILINYLKSVNAKTVASPTKSRSEEVVTQEHSYR